MFIANFVETSIFAMVATAIVCYILAIAASVRQFQDSILNKILYAGICLLVVEYIIFTII